MNCRQARKTFEELIDKGIPVRYTPELKRHLERCPACREWCDLEQRVLHRLERLETGPVAADWSQEILDRLPDVPLKTLDQVVRLLVRAWEEPGFRERLRAHPRRVLAAEGVDLPAGLRIIVVPPSEACLPTRELLAMPLPKPGDGSRTAQDLAAQLRHTPAAVLVEPETAWQLAPCGPPGPRERLDGALVRMEQAWDSFASSLTRPAPRRMLAPALVVVASLLVALGLLYGLRGGELPSTPGAATGNWSWAVGGGVVVILVVLVAVAFWRRKK
jgi:hypothetical protein